MKLAEDRHPLLYVYLDNERAECVRSRCVSRGATTLIGKWPEHLTFSWLMGVVSLVSLLTCFLLAVVLLIVSSTAHHHGRRSLLEKCERNEHVIQLVHMKNLEDLTVNENATYFVEIFYNKSETRGTACSLETYLWRTSLPVYLVSIFPNLSPKSLPLYEELEKKYSNFKTIFFDLNSFFNRTVFSNFQTEDPKFLSFLAKILVSWNVGGTVIDSRLKTLRNFQGLLPKDDKTAVVGVSGEEVVFFSSRRFCHVYIFDVLKAITETKNIFKYSEAEVIKMAQKRFCHGSPQCRGLKLYSHPEFCERGRRTENCIFLLPRLNETFNVSVNSSLCPMVGKLK